MRFLSYWNPFWHPVRRTSTCSNVHSSPAENDCRILHDIAAQATGQRGQTSHIGAGSGHHLVRTLRKDYTQQVTYCIADHSLWQFQTHLRKESHWQVSINWRLVFQIKTGQKHVFMFFFLAELNTGFILLPYRKTTLQIPANFRCTEAAVCFSLPFPSMMTSGKHGQWLGVVKALDTSDDPRRIGAPGSHRVIGKNLRQKMHKNARSIKNCQTGSSVVAHDWIGRYFNKRPQHDPTVLIHIKLHKVRVWSLP